jgi:hypothetical protein
MTRARAPLAVARAGVELSVRALPDWHDRLRYRAEYLAELHDLAPAGQLRYTAGVLSQTFALRTALGASPTGAEEDAMTIATTKAPFWRCRVFRWHRWVMRSTEDGGRYMTCARCDRDRDNIPFGSYSIGPPGGAG